jgi:hypothetical protein
MKNDHLCKFIGFSLTKEENILRLNAETKFKTNNMKSPVYNVLCIQLKKLEQTLIILIQSWTWNEAARNIYLEKIYTMPVVVIIYLQDIYEIVDGYHRYTTLKNI